MEGRAYRPTHARRTLERRLAVTALYAIGVAALLLLASFAQPRRVTSPSRVALVAYASLDVAPARDDDGAPPPVASAFGEGDSDAEDDDDDEDEDRFGDESTIANAVDLDAPGAPCVRVALRPESSSVKSRTLEPETPPPRS